MAKNRKDLELEAKALFITDEEIEGATTNADLKELIASNQPSEGCILIKATQEMIDEDTDRYVDDEVGDIVEVEIEEEVGDIVEVEIEEEVEEKAEGEHEDGDLIRAVVQGRLKKDGMIYNKGDSVKFRYDASIGSLLADGVLEIV